MAFSIHEILKHVVTFHQSMMEADIALQQN